MSGTDALLERTSHAQARASDPSASAWVSANAGSGKTYVLTRRVIRLMLDGAEPSKILCLTFTKAAAAEMSRRVFDLLAKWTECDDDALSAELRELEGYPPDRAMMTRARKLFARALETPGGLKIQTIHAFCESLLQRFPIEADVPGHFRVLDERDQADLIDQARARVFASAPDHRDATISNAFSTILDATSDFQIAEILGEIIDKRHVLEAWLADTGGVDPAIQDLFRLYGLSETETDADLDDRIVQSPIFSLPYLQHCLQVLPGGGKTDKDLATAIKAFLEEQPGPDRAGLWLAIFRTKGGAFRKTDRLITKAIKAELPDFIDKAAAESARLEELCDRRAAHGVISLTGAYLRLGSAVLEAYQDAKIRRGFLDFEDLIVRSLALLSKSDAAQWVQYKLDQGIDHILVDEAQDTSARQWEIVRALAGDFFAGEAARPFTRTLFAVGDEKQSIYSFQGAEPRYFAQMRDFFSERAREARETFHAIALRLSFRSTPDVLGAVDQVFADSDAAAGLSSDGEPILHDAVRFTDPGDVSVWPMFADVPAPEPDDWSKPIDVENPQSAKVRLAEHIAAEIGTWIDNADRLAGGKRIDAGDVLILVRKRDAFLPALVRALKARAIPVAGSDRLALTGHIAVRDLIALGRVVVLPDDDLSLAATLKGPLFDWREEDLFDIAYDRGQVSLWTSLNRKAQAGSVKAGLAVDRLRGWMAVADFERPFEFFTRILDRDGGRLALRARFGQEVDDVIDQFMLITLDSESQAPPSLDRFLAGLDRAEIVIKREMDEARGEVRIMTVHGAKGLEAPVVFLVDPGSAPRHASHDPLVIELERPDGAPALSLVRTFAGIPRLAETRIDNARRAGEEEYRRLLYVALTRARDRLVVCGYHGPRGAAETCWHRLVWAGLAGEAEERPFGPDGSAMLHWQKTPLPSDTEHGDTPEERPQVQPLPTWVEQDAPGVVQVQRLTPSDALEGETSDEPGPKVPPRDLLAEALDGDGIALRRGRLVHRLLETLPEIEPEAWHEAARKATDRALPDISEQDRNLLAGDIVALLEDPGFSTVFSTRGRAEVSLNGWIELADGSRRLVSGQIDRLLVTEDRITIVDFKTNRIAPDTIANTPPQYITQLALYRKLLAAIYPGRTIDASLLWTTSPSLMPVPAALMDDALDTIRRMDRADETQV